MSVSEVARRPDGAPMRASCRDHWLAAVAETDTGLLGLGLYF